MQMLAVNFHYIRNEKPKEGIYPRSVNEFKYQIAELARHYEFLSLSELQKMISDGGKSKGNYCVITFDDNLKEQMCIFDYLENNAIPAIFFSTTLPYLNTSVHDVHKTHHIYTQHTDENLASYLDKKHGFYNVSFTEEQTNNAYSYDNELKKKIKLFLNFMLPDDEKKLLIDELFSESVGSLDEFIKDFYLSKDDLRMLAAKGMLGTHTHTHYPLATLTEEKINTEIITSIKYLEELTSMKIKAISYPYGRHGAVNEKVASISGNLGLDVGFTMNRGLNTAADMRKALMLKRVDTNDAPGGKLNSLEYLPD